MEGMTLDERVEAFLRVDFGYGYGSRTGYGTGYGYGSRTGSGTGYGTGTGSGTGYGTGYGYGSRTGSGTGCGSGTGTGSGEDTGYDIGYSTGNIKLFNREKVWVIDDVMTVIGFVHGNLAKGFIVNDDLTTDKCFVAKYKNLFAHGKTVKEAQEALREKLFANMDIDDKIETFIAEVKVGEKYPAKYFYDWHHRLTGSCKMGRDKFVKEHQIDIENDTFTVADFIKLCRSEYGSEVIGKVEERMKERI